MKWFRYIVGGICVVGVVAVTVGGLRKRPPDAVKVDVAVSRLAPIARMVSGAGKLEASRTVKISSSLSGDLIARPVVVGQLVKAGQLLGRIDPRRFRAMFDQSRAALSAAQADLVPLQIEVSRLEREQGRVDDLAKRGLASKAEAERAKFDVEVARARETAQRDRARQAAASLDEARNNLSKTELVSPIDGTVIEVSRQVGERVRGSDFNEDVVMTLASMNAMEMKIEVNEHEVVHLKAGQKATIRVDAFDGQSFEGKIREIAQKALIKNPGTDQEVTSFPVVVLLDAKPDGVLPGMSGEVTISAEERPQALVVPIQSVTVRSAKSLEKVPLLEGEEKPKNGGKNETFVRVVFVVDADNKAHIHRVKTGISSESLIEIVQGLKEGDRVVSGPYRTLSKELNDGDRVIENKPMGASL